MTTIELTDEQAAAAAAVTDDILTRLTPGTASVEPFDSASRQVFTALADGYLHRADAGYRLSPTPAPPVLADGTTGVFDSYADAETWYRANAPRLMAIVHRAATAGLDDLACRLYICLEPMMQSTHDLATWAQMSPHALAAARRSGDPGMLARTLGAVGILHKMSDQPAQAIDAYTEALDLYRSLGDAAGVVAAINWLGVAHLAARHLDAAEQAFDQILALAPDNVVRCGLARVNKASVYNARGEFASAISAAMDALATFGGVENHRVQPWQLQAQIELIRAHTGSGDYAAAERHVHDARQLIDAGAPMSTIRTAVMIAIGDLRLAQGRHAEALTVFQDAMLHQVGGSPYLTADIADGIGRAWFGLGDAQRAAALHTDVLTARRRIGEPVATAGTLGHLAAALHVAGRTEQAAQRREQALAALSGIVDPATDALRSRLLDTAASDR